MTGFPVYQNIVPPCQILCMWCDPMYETPIPNLQGQQAMDCPSWQWLCHCLTWLALQCRAVLFFRKDCKTSHQLQIVEVKMSLLWCPPATCCYSLTDSLPSLCGGIQFDHYWGLRSQNWGWIVRRQVRPPPPKICLCLLWQVYWALVRRMLTKLPNVHVLQGKIMKRTYPHSATNIPTREARAFIETFSNERKWDASFWIECSLYTGRENVIVSVSNKIPETPDDRLGLLWTLGCLLEIPDWWVTIGLLKGPPLVAPWWKLPVLDSWEMIRGMPNWLKNLIAGFVAFEMANGMVQSLNGRHRNYIRMCGGPAWKLRRLWSQVWLSTHLLGRVLSWTICDRQCLAACTGLLFWSVVVLCGSSNTLDL